jgi:hypothetical protein
MLIRRDRAEISVDVQEFGFGYCGDAAKRLEDGVEDVAVEAHEGDGLGSALGCLAAEGECCDVDSVFAEHRAYLADDAGLVAIS